MISAINQEIEAFLSSVKGINESSNQMILDKFSTSISDNLENGHLTTNVCMIAASVLKLNPKELAKDLEKHLVAVATEALQAQTRLTHLLPKLSKG